MAIRHEHEGQIIRIRDHAMGMVFHVKCIHCDEDYMVITSRSEEHEDWVEDTMEDYYKACVLLET